MKPVQERGYYSETHSPAWNSAVSLTSLERWDCLLSRPSSTPDSDFVGVPGQLFPLMSFPGLWHVEDPGSRAGGQNSLHIWILATSGIHRERS